MKEADKKKTVANMIRVIIDICKMSIMQRKIDSPQNLNDEKGMPSGENALCIVFCILFSLSLQIKSIPCRKINKSKLSTKACLKYDNEYWVKNKKWHTMGKKEWLGPYFKISHIPC